jgi:DNA repair protein RecO (recombination protein O)
MNTGVVTSGIVLSRTNFGEADRILTIITPDHGKVRVIAKGVRKSASKLAGGIELFSVSHITFIRGKGDISTLISTRLVTHYGKIVQDVERTMFGYELLKMFNRVTEDNAEPDYFKLLQHALAAVNEPNLSLDIIRFWLYMRLLRLSGHSPNLKTDTSGNKLQAGKKYNFSVEDMTFTESAQGRYNPQHIKLLRLGLGLESPRSLLQVQDIQKVLPADLQLAKTMLQQFVRI